LWVRRETPLFWHKILERFQDLVGLLLNARTPDVQQLSILCEISVWNEKGLGQRTRHARTFSGLHSGDGIFKYEPFAALSQLAGRYCGRCTDVATKDLPRGNQENVGLGLAAHIPFIVAANSPSLEAVEYFAEVAGLEVKIASARRRGDGHWDVVRAKVQNELFGAGEGSDRGPQLVWEGGALLEILCGNRQRDVGEEREEVDGGVVFGCPST
jgi:hypothetical protein